MRKSIQAFLALAVFVFAVGCGGLGITNLLPPTGGQNQSSIVGKWKVTQISQNGTTVNCPGTLGSGAGSVSCDSSIFTYNSDGSWQEISALGSDEADGSWAVTGGQLVIINSSTGTTTTGTLSFSPDNNTYYEVVNGVTYQAARQ